MTILEHQPISESTTVRSLGTQAFGAISSSNCATMRAGRAWPWDKTSAAGLLITATIREELIRPGETWDDTQGPRIQAHGGRIFYFQHTPSLNPDKRYVNCYSSRDQVAFLHLPLEGGALVHYWGLYYVIGSHLTGWRPNPNVYASAPSLSHSWSEFAPIVTASPDTYGSQSSMLLAVSGSKTTSVIFTGDMWEPKSLWDSCYLWMPVTIGDGKMLLPAPSPWTIDIKTGLTVRGF
jgi:hypothetical protein